MKELPSRQISDNKLRGVFGIATIGTLPIKTNHGYSQKTSIRITAAGEKTSAIQLTLLNLENTFALYTFTIEIPAIGLPKSRLRFIIVLFPT
jgi:hypothetical protein